LTQANDVLVGIAVKLTRGTVLYDASSSGGIGKRTTTGSVAVQS